MSVGAKNSRTPLAKQKSGYGWTEIDGHHVAYFGEDVVSDGIADLKAINDLRSLPYRSGEELLVYRLDSDGEPYISTVLSSDGDQVDGNVSSSDPMIAIAHTHPLYSRRDIGRSYRTQNRLNENFGPGDHHNIISNQKPNYLRTQSGIIKVLEARSGRITVRTLTGDEAGNIELWVRRRDQ
ncbi:hypothetical protein [Microbulbifer sp. JTAC008]|uniref:hypothetical protein n=1 Tax=unclassified Microbulbifer TaxID=2619833 RepID=UPI00403A056F